MTTSQLKVIVGCSSGHNCPVTNGWMKRKLARLLPPVLERNDCTQDAREAWTKIDRLDLGDDLERESTAAETESNDDKTGLLARLTDLFGTR